MQTLIRHELWTAAVHFVIPLLAGIIMSIACAVGFIHNESHWLPIGIPMFCFKYTWPIVFFTFIASVLGDSQMNSDRKNKTSSYFCTLATTRRQILAARLLVGLIWNFIAILPILICFFLLAIFPQLLPIDWFFLVRITVLLFLLNTACYGLGLLIGGFENRLLQVAALFPFVFILCIPMIKGMGWESYAFLIVITLAAITLVWQKFLKMPL